MGKLEIVDKLESLLNNHMAFTEECHVVYLLVEVRKILDRENSKKYPLLRFYSDWSVHTAKDHITPGMKSIMEEIYSDIYNTICSPSLLGEKKTKIVGFMYMEDLRSELYNFLEEYELPNVWPLDENNWLSLVTLLVSILADQPINNPCKDIKQFSFLPARPGCVRGVVIFNSKINDYNHFEFGNVY